MIAELSRPWRLVDVFPLFLLPDLHEHAESVADEKHLLSVKGGDQITGSEVIMSDKVTPRERTAAALVRP